MGPASCNDSSRPGCGATTAKPATPLHASSLPKAFGTIQSNVACRTPARLQQGNGPVRAVAQYLSMPRPPSANVLPASMADTHPLVLARHFSPYLVIIAAAVHAFCLYSGLLPAGLSRGPSSKETPAPISESHRHKRTPQHTSWGPPRIRLWAAMGWPADLARSLSFLTTPRRAACRAPHIRPRTCTPDPRSSTTRRRGS